MLTERLALRRFTTADKQNLLSLDGDPQVMRFLTGTARSLAQIRDEVLPGLAGCHLRFPGYGYWAAETRGQPRATATTARAASWIAASCAGPRNDSA